MINPGKKRRIGVKKGQEGQNYVFCGEIRWIRVWGDLWTVDCGVWTVVEGMEVNS